MKRNLKNIILSGILLSFLGCSSTPKAEIASPKRNCIVDNKQAPNWVCGVVPQDENLYGIGASKNRENMFNFSRTEAVTNARVDLSHSIETEVKSKVESFVRATGTSDESMDRVFTTVSKSLSHQILSGSVQSDLWTSDKQIFVLVKVPKQNIDKSIKKFQSSYKNDDKLWQQFQSKQSLESLEKDLSNL